MAIKRAKKTGNKANREECAKSVNKASPLPTSVLADRLHEGSVHYRYGIPGCLSDIAVIIPSFEENESIIDNLVKELQKNGAEVIVVDDGSLKKAYPESIKHGTNFGYGAAIMTGIKNSKRPYVMTIDADGQHTIDNILRLSSAWKLMKVDMLIGARKVENEVWYRFLGRKFLNWTASLICFYWLRDLNSGIRIFKRNIVEGYIPILCKNFSFTTSLTLSMFLDGYKIEWFPIEVKSRKYGKSKVNVFKHGWITLYYILRIGFALRTRRIRAKWQKLKKYLSQVISVS